MQRWLVVGVTVWTALWSSGCYVASLYPFYTSQDVVFDPGLVGTWVGEEDAVWTISRAKGESDAYTVEIPEDTSFILSPGAPKVMSAFTVRLFRLDGMLFMDAFPAPSATCDNGFSWNALQAGMHVVYRVWREGDTLRLQGLEPDKVDALVQAPAHVHLDQDGSTYDRPGGPTGANLVLTAPTAELQAFIRRHLDGLTDDDIGVMHRRNP